MINGIRFQASQLLQLSSVSKIQSEFNPQEAFEDSLDTVTENQNTETGTQNFNGSYMALGMPAGFNIDYSLLEEMERNSAEE